MEICTSRAEALNVSKAWTEFQREFNPRDLKLAVSNTHEGIEATANCRYPAV